MTIDSSQFWNLLSESGLVRGADLHDLNATYDAARAEIDQQPEFQGLSEVETLSKWLVQQKVLSDFQADILAKGASGPFKYGNYTVVGSTDSGPLKSSFSAVHQSTGHPVLLQFLPGNSPDDLSLWQGIETLITKVSELESDHLAAVYEAVVLPNYRFVVSQQIQGKNLAIRVPRKARMPWQDACKVLNQAGQGVACLHQQGLSHNAISPRAIWLSSSVPAQLRIQIMPDVVAETGGDLSEESRYDYLAPEQPDQGGSPAADIYAMGCVLYRLTTGRVHKHPDSDDLPPDSRGITKELAKRELPPPLIQLIESMLSPHPSKRPSIIAVLSAMDELVPSQSGKSNSAPAPASQLAYRAWLSKFKPGSLQSDIKKLPKIQPQIAATANPQATPISRIASRQKPKWALPIAIAASLATLGLLATAFLIYANQRVVSDLPQQTTQKGIPADPQKGKTDDPKTDDSPTTSPSGQWQQQLMEDDGGSLWETPTLGDPIDFSYVPPGAKLIFTFRLANLLQEEQGQLLVDSIGPKLKAQFDRWQQKTGIPLNEIKRLTLSLHPVDFEYQTVFMVQTTKPLKRQRLLELWNKPESTELEMGARIFVGSGDTAYYFTEGDSQPETTQKFLMGPTDLIRESADLAGAVTLSGAMKNLAEVSDRDRQISIFFLRNALFNDEGQKLMGGSLADLNRYLSATLDDSIRGVLLSLHLDNGSFFELQFDQTLDLKPAEFQEWLTSTSQKSLDQITQFAASSPANSYWNPVRSRYAGMIMDLYRNLRIGVERGNVIANCWLPPMAAHNIVGGTELLLNYANGTNASTPITRPNQGPDSLEQLLEMRRDLNVTTNPDLNILLADLQSEITDDLGEMPFPFEIRLLGNDLLAEGITKNQRPGEFDLKQKTLAEILTEIMTRANPTKDISGPEDPNCKLIWVVGPDPDQPDKNIILITTRAAAADKGYKLPSVFQSE